MPMASDIAEKLEDESVGTVGTDIFIGKMPETPDACIAVYASAGEPIDHVTGALEFPNLQVRVRGTAAAGGWTAAETLAYLIISKLHRQWDQTFEGVKYYFIESRGSPMQMGFDKSERPLFSINFRVTKEVE